MYFIKKAISISELLHLHSKYEYFRFKNIFNYMYEWRILFYNIVFNAIASIHFREIDVVCCFYLFPFVRNSVIQHSKSIGRRRLFCKRYC